MKMRVMTSVVLGLGLVMGACSSSERSGGASGGDATSGGSTTVSRGNSKVDRAVRVAKAVQMSPGEGEAALRANGMTVQQYEDLMYEIAEDPAMSAEFNERLGG